MFICEAPFLSALLKPLALIMVTLCNFSVQVHYATYVVLGSRRNCTENVGVKTV